MDKSISTTAAGRDISGGFFIRILSVITLAGWLLRAISAWEMASAAGGINNIFTPPPTSDLATYMTLARECAAGNFPSEFYYQPYYYAVFLALIYFVFGSVSIYAVIFIQSLISAATIFLTGLCGRKIFSERAGILAAVMVAVSSSLILYVPYHQNETLQTFHLILLFYLTLEACERDNLYCWAATGVAGGIAILTRGNVWTLVPVIVVAAYFSGTDKKRAWKKIILFMLCLIAVQLPFIIRNSTGSLRGASTAADAVLALGNGMDVPAGGRESFEGAGAMYYSESYRRMMANTTGEYARSVPRQMVDWFIDKPAAFLELQFRKALLFWDGREIPNNVSLEHDGCSNSVILKYLLLGRNHILLALGAGGMLWFLFSRRQREKKSKNLLLLYAFTIVFYLSVVVFYILSRFKAPLLPFLTVFAAGAISQWFEMRRQKQRRDMVLAAASLISGVWLSTSAYDLYRSCEKYIWQYLYPRGIVMDLNGENILHFDHGPKPYGGWKDVRLTPGMTLIKNFPAAGKGNIPAEIQLMMRNINEVKIKISLNGRVLGFTLPPYTPGKSDRKMVRLPGMLHDGNLYIMVLEISGGDLWCSFDRQRDYGRSRLDNNPLPGEWVVRAGVPRGL